MKVNDSAMSQDHGSKEDLRIDLKQTKNRPPSGQSIISSGTNAPGLGQGSIAGNSMGGMDHDRIGRLLSLF